jgi:SOS-response transcriptional repressor LexA
MELGGNVGMTEQVKLTTRQAEVLNFIKFYVSKHGYPPTIREITKGINCNSTSTAHNIVENLALRGFIQKGDGPRTIKVVDIAGVDPKPGLYDKYTVINNETGQAIDGVCFVLRPDKDAAAFGALLQYAELTPNTDLAMDITRWLSCMEATHE